MWWQQQWSEREKHPSKGKPKGSQWSMVPLPLLPRDLPAVNFGELGTCFHKGGGDPSHKPWGNQEYEKQQKSQGLSFLLPLPRLSGTEGWRSHSSPCRCPKRDVPASCVCLFPIRRFFPHTFFPKSPSDSSLFISLRVETFFLCPKQQSQLQGGLQGRLPWEVHLELAS